MDKEEQIRVVIRARPYNGASNDPAKQTNQECVASNPENPREVFVYTDAAHTRAATFRCETFIPSTATQEEVFEQVRAKELVEAALDGFPVTIFAYGQTGAGKSFTIFGKEDGVTERTVAVHSLDGLLPRTGEGLMHAVAERKGKVDYTLRVTCVEIYNEQVRDVFDPRKETLAVRSSKTHGFFLENATVVECVTAREIVRVVKAAATHRAKSSHLLNERSNRSHCLVTIYIDAAPVKPDAPDTPLVGKRYGKITIVDLAGSERVTDSRAVGTQLRETCHINRSLHCLSQVIQAINVSKGSKIGRQKFVPYRDSKLTMLLLDSLGGNSKTLMLACVNSSPQFATESVRTLEFAMGVAKIKNRPTALLNPHEKLISDLREQIRLLKLENMMLRARTPGYFSEHPTHEMETSTMLSSRADNNSQPQQKLLKQSFNNAGFRTGARSRQKSDQLGQQQPRRKDQPQRRTHSSKKKNLKRKSASFNIQDSLPPVNKVTPSQQSLQYAAPHFEAIMSNQATNPMLPRTNTPPPAYDELFGIETIPIPQQQSISQQRAADAQVSRMLEELSPEQQLQQLLQQMLPQSQPQPLPSFPVNSRPMIPSKSPKPRASSNNTAKAGISSNNNTRSEDWDDQRAQDLFLQLCSL